MEENAKAQLRKFYAGRRRELPETLRKSFDARIVDRIRRLRVYRAADCVAFFVSWGAEPDLSALFGEKRIFLPRFNAELKGYELVEITDPATDLIPGRYQIPEPRPGLPAARRNPELLFFVPAVACDRAGTRLGRGGGFYDRMLEKIEIAPVGVIYSCQLSNSFLPREPHDHPMGTVVTEEEILDCAGWDSGEKRREKDE